MQRYTRRDFLKLVGLALAGAAVRPASLSRVGDYEDWDNPPAPLGRIASWGESIRRYPTLRAKRVGWRGHDTILPLYASVVGERVGRNAIWYLTRGGFIHSAYVQPVWNRPAKRIEKYVAEPGFWAEVCVPITEARTRPNGGYVVHRLYYGSVYRVIAVLPDERGVWWYRLREGIAWGPGPYVPAQHLRRVPPTALAPISPNAEDKHIVISLRDQLLVCYEGEREVFRTFVSTGVGGSTKWGEHRVLYKRPTRRMIGENYDLPGVPYPVYITDTGIAIHGAYWHNDFGQVHSHGCVNVPIEASRWIFRWVDPIAAYTDYTRMAPPDGGTPVRVEWTL